MRVYTILMLMVLFVFGVSYWIDSSKPRDSVVIEDAKVQTNKIYLNNVIITNAHKIQKFCDGDHLVYLSSTGSISVVPYGCKD